MSKSVGNVISPKDVVEKTALGVDVLRWWVAAHASSAASVMVGDAILAASKVDVDRIRNTVRFVLGLLEDKEQEGEVRLVLLDRAMLHRLHRHTAACAEHYEAMEYNKVCLASNAFLSQLISSCSPPGGAPVPGPRPGRRPRHPDAAPHQGDEALLPSAR
jgi:isoleucyl-tRNA synthetase